MNQISDRLALTCTADDCYVPATMITDYPDDMPQMPLCDSHAMGLVVPLARSRNLDAAAPQGNR